MAKLNAKPSRYVAIALCCAGLWVTKFAQIGEQLNWGLSLHKPLGERTTGILTLQRRELNMCSSDSTQVSNQFHKASHQDIRNSHWREGLGQGAE